MLEISFKGNRFTGSEEENRKSILNILAKREREIKNIKASLRIKRFFKDPDDKKAIQEILDTLQKTESKLNLLFKAIQRNVSIKSLGS